MVAAIECRLQLDASGYIAAAERDCRELVFINGQLTATGKKRKPKTPPKPVDREWLKKRKKLLKALRNEKVKN